MQRSSEPHPSSHLFSDEGDKDGRGGGGGGIIDGSGGKRRGRIDDDGDDNDDDKSQYQDLSDESLWQRLGGVFGPACGFLWGGHFGGQDV